MKVNKDSRGVDTSAGPAIDTKNVQTQVLVENGGTVVLGGIYEQQDRTTVTKVPVLGDLPVVGYLFKKLDEPRAALLQPEPVAAELYYHHPILSTLHHANRILPPQGYPHNRISHIHQHLYHWYCH